ncbi:hypothetical protein Tco_0555858 [Tanacetum coccineum]
MNPQETQQVAACDEKWVPSAERVKISSTNMRLETTVPQKEETFQVIINVIKNSTCFNAFTISADVLEIFMQQFWYTIKKVQDTNSYEFLLANKKCIVNAKFFRTILNICPRVEGEDFTDGNVDYPELIWEDLPYQIDHRKEKRSRRKDYQEYGHPIPDVMLPDAIKHSKSYQMFIKYSTNQIPPKKSRGKGSKGKKTAKESRETIDVSKESEPEPEPAKKKTASRRVVKKKVILSADDNIFFDDPDAPLELAKSISKSKAGEAEATRKVHATHARIVTESVSESAKKKSSDRSSKSIVIQDTPSAPKSKSATSKAKLKGVLNQDKDITKEEVILKWGDEQDSEHSNDDENDKKDGDANDEGDDHVSDAQDADDEDVETESDEDDINKYKIPVRKDEDEEMKDAEVEGSDKGDEEIIDATKEEAEKTSEAKDDTKKTEFLPSSSSLLVSSGFGDQFLKLFSYSSLVSTVKDSTDADDKTTNLLPIPEIVTETPVTTVVPLPQVTPIFSYVQQTPPPIPTPPVTTDAPTVTTVVPESVALSNVELRVAKLEKEVSELKIVDHSSKDLAVL